MCRVAGSTSFFAVHPVAGHLQPSRLRLRPLPLAEAIRKITSMPTQRQRLFGRGQIQVGYFADITMFDPAAIIDRATYTDSTKLSEGVDTVLVNGHVEFEHGSLTGVNAGRALQAAIDFALSLSLEAGRPLAQPGADLARWSLLRGWACLRQIGRVRTKPSRPQAPERTNAHPRHSPSTSSCEVLRRGGALG